MSRTALLERKGDAAVTIPGMEHKAAVAAEPPDSGILAIDEDQGIVEAIVSVTGIVDNVNDRILPGAYTKTLKDRRPKGVWNHQWGDWVSRTEAIEEYLPGDSRLPTQTKDGKTWPKEAGALVVRTRFDMKRDRSRDAFQAVQFFSETGEAEWSIGYVVPPGAATKDRQGVRNIKALNLFEYSPVLFGAASESMTLSTKSAAPGVAEQHAEVLDGLGGTSLGDAESLPDGSFLIRTPADVTAAVSAYPRASDRVEAKTHIVARAAALGAVATLPDGWAAEYKVAMPDEADAVLGDEADVKAEWDDDDQAALDADVESGMIGPDGDSPDPDDDPDLEPVDRVERKYNTAPLGKPGNRENWVDQSGGLPLFIRAIAHALKRKGFTTSRAIATAVNTVKRWAAGTGDVSPKTRAKAVKTLAEWDAKKAKARATPNGKPGRKGADSLIVTAVDPPDPDPQIEVKAGHLEEVLDIETKFWGAPTLPGTWEERQHALREAVTMALRGNMMPATTNRLARYEWPDCHIVGTYDDHVIATRHDYESMNLVPEPESFSIDYTWNDDDGVILGEPEPVKLSVVTVVGEMKGIEPVEAMAGLPDMLADVTAGLVTHLAARPEIKAGRVLSNVNETRLRSATEALLAVLAQAGINVTMPDSKPDAAVEPDPGSTAPMQVGGAAPVMVKARMVDGVLIVDTPGVMETKTVPGESGVPVSTETVPDPNTSEPGLDVARTETQPPAGNDTDEAARAQVESKALAAQAELASLRAFLTG